MILARLQTLALALAMVSPSLTAAAATATAGQPAPPWQLNDLNGRPVSLNDYTGRVVVLEFFRTTCVPCLWEIPDFKDLQDQYGPDGLVIIGVAAEEDAATLRPFAQTHGIDYLLCPSNDSILWDYNVFPLGGIPLTTLIDRSGVVADWYRYYQARDYHEERILPLLAARPGPALSIVRVDAVLEISWPVSEEEFVLESRATLAPDQTWEPVSEEVKTMGDRHFITWSAAQGSAFFRLRKP